MLMLMLLFLQCATQSAANNKSFAATHRHVASRRSASSRPSSAHHSENKGRRCLRANQGSFGFSLAPSSSLHHLRVPHTAGGVPPYDYVRWAAASRYAGYHHWTAPGKGRGKRGGGGGRNKRSPERKERRKGKGGVKERRRSKTNHPMFYRKPSRLFPFLNSILHLVCRPLVYPNANSSRSKS
ncbi:hypothetical protein K456DRAFT_1604088 [Colletotrichum gloeosporioides 23]|nr:hypothetical protein K456DRAFT_1604088 [Colletotrichum gloeosporioides 23]